MFSPLSVVWDVSPYIVTIGRLELRWYSLLFVAGFVLGYYMFKHFFRNEGLPVEKLMDPLLYTLVIATLIGSRLGHCLFYDPGYYLTAEHFGEIFQPWKGGLASHGGAIAVVLSMWWYANHYGKKYGFDFLWMMDRLVIAVCFAGAFIRLGNLFNSEIYGNPTTLPWGFEFVRDRQYPGTPCHPTQLYEALTYVILGLGLLAAYKFKLDRLKKGTLFGVFMIALFGARFIIEFIKRPQEAFEEGMLLDMGQILSIPFILAGIVLLIWSLRKALPAKIPVKTNGSAKKIQ